MKLSFLDGHTVPRWFWPLVLGLNLLLHLPFFAQPPNSVHVWRQSNTMAVARNLYEEDMNLLRPRVDRRNESDGVTGMQFPSYEWVVAVGYKVLGFHEAIPRVVTWLIFAGGVLAFFALVQRLSGSRWLAAVGAWGLSWSPELFYHSINALPDVLALSASVAGLFYFLRWYQERRALDFWLSLLLTTLAGLTKLQYLVIGFPIAVLILRDLWQRRLSWRRDALPLLVFAVVTVGCTLAWYAYAVRLIETSGLADFGLELRPASDLAAAVKTLTHNLISDIPELLINYGNFGLLVLGLVAVARGGYVRRYWFGPLLAWALALLAYHLIELRQMSVHQYYMLPYLPVLLLVVVVGAGWLAQQPKWRWALALLLVAQPVLAFVRIAPARWMGGAREVPTELFEAATRAELSNAVPDSALCVVGPDESGCKYFYFLHKKGFGYNESAQLFAPGAGGQPYLANCIQRGAQYLYTNDTTLLTQDPRLQPYVARTVRQVGSFRVLALRPAVSATPDSTTSR
ncbi:ArnT family glycosyltransferase [Hymenobacter chitinivorans]|uniref:Dolichyl-phosphate-mannose-protein mannosyltransferase n=1 Tax=Hymenobacter chitinivorans DSM 11115 TaxID=1121954 RepID=A0A2M9ARZ5_9BACT|nr:glycosyltransferase family 39 protein [Hymenobacter chitinivorans]PJJ48476.1 dolichyl-phosphate-mannose-protein mannosyltransferase [Hymenobacter chitinivorans DSM 11115]